MNRKLSAHASGKLAAQGRPLGHCVAWLWAAQAVPKEDHAKLRRGGGAFKDLVNFDVRKRARDFAEADSELAVWMARNEVQERPRREGEDIEPVRVP